MKLKITLIATLIIILSPAGILAHGTGQTIVIDKDDYQIDIDLDSETLEAGQSVRFDFGILDLTGKGLDTKFDYVWVRIQSGQKVIFAGGLGKPSFGPVGLTTVLPDAGEYLISARFQKNEEKIVEGETIFNVSKGSQSQSSIFNLSSLFMVVAGLVLGFFFGPFFKKWF